MERSPPAAPPTPGMMQPGLLRGVVKTGFGPPVGLPAAGLRISEWSLQVNHFQRLGVPGFNVETSFLQIPQSLWCRLNQSCFLSARPQLRRNPELQGMIVRQVDHQTAFRKGVSMLKTCRMGE